MKLFDTILKRQKSHVGIDIGSYAIKVVELSLEKDSLEIKNLAYTKIENPNSRDQLIQAVKESTARANILNKEVNISVSGPSVIVRFIELPRMSGNELRNAISFEAEKYIPFGIEEVIIDHQLLIPHLGDNKMLVLLVAVKKELITERINLLSEAGLFARTVDVASLANFNAFLTGANRKKYEVAAFIDIGARATDINIIDRDILYFTRSIQIGGNDITKVLADARSIDFKSAESIKVKPSDKASEISENISPVLHNIIDEIRPSFSYYENLSGKSIERVYLTGGSSRIINFHNMLKEDLEMEIEQWDPLERIELHPSIDKRLADSIKDQLGVAVGLALR